MAAIQKKVKLEHRTVDSAFLFKDPKTGEERSVSTKCAQLDADMPLHLGVSKAILENVIFCHQEDSNWPLAEPSVLKKKFDDIFAATKFTKALDNMKSLRKEKSQQLMLDKQELEFLKHNKEKASKVRLQIEVTEEQISRAKNRIEDIKKSADNYSDQYSDAQDKYKRYQSTDSKIQSISREIEMLENQKDSLARTITKYTQTDEQLENLLNEQKELSNNTKDGIEKCKERRNSHEESCRKIQRDLNEKASLRGKYQSDHENYLNKLSKRDEMIKKFSVELQTDMFHKESITGEDASSFISVLMESIKSITSDLNEKRQTFQYAKSEIEEEMKQLNYEKNSKDALKSVKRKNRQENIKKLAELLNQTHQLSQEQNKLEEQRLQKIELEKELNVLKQEQMSLDEEKTHADLTNQLNDVESAIKLLKEELGAANELSEIRKKLEYKNIELSEKKAILQENVASCMSHIKDNLNLEIVHDDLYGYIERLLQQERKDLESLDLKNHEIKIKSESVKTREAIICNELSSKKLRQEELDKMIKEKFGEDFLGLLNTTEESIITKQKEINISESGLDVFTELKAVGEKDQVCPICDCALNKEKIIVLQTKIDKLISGLRPAPELKSELNELIEKRTEMYQLRDFFIELTRLCDEQIPCLEQKLKIVSDDSSNLMLEISKNDQDVASLKKKVEVLEQAFKKAEGIRLLEEEIRDIESFTFKLRDNLKESGTARTLEEIQSKLEHSYGKEKELASQIQDLNAKVRNLHDKVTVNEKKISSIEMHILRLEHKLQDQQRLEEQKNRLRSDNETLEKEMNDIENNIKELEPKYEDLNLKLKSIQDSFDQERSAIESRLEQLKSAHLNLDSIHAEVEKYIGESKHARLDQIDKEICKLNSEIESHRAEIASIDVQISEISKQLSEIQVTERNIQDNFQFRRLEREVEDKKKLICDLHAEKGNFDLDAHVRLMKTIKSQLESALEQKSGLQGEIRQMQFKIEEFEKELSSEYKDIEEKYRVQLIRLRTTKMAHDDLEKYAKALDGAIMKFHSMKMAEINRIIAELWNSTYRGSDIDTIEIRSDHASAKGNRSYNYRVVMKSSKKNAIIDMRGRCSAGQKVLASIIIRLALSETFCINCGILALDEPTTNLDKDNIDSLAASLNSIIKTRKKQSNFQLLVITHDEEFMQKMGRSEFAESYYEVLKDENQYSQIFREDFASRHI